MFFAQVNKTYSRFCPVSRNAKNESKINQKVVNGSIDFYLTSEMLGIPNLTEIEKRPFLY